MKLPSSSPVLMVVAVDPGVSSVVTVFLNSSTEYDEKIEARKGDCVWDELFAISRQYDYDAAVLVIEEQYLGENPNSMIKTVESRVRWETCAEILGWEVVRVYPETWQSSIFGHVRGRKRKERKKLSKKVYRQTLGFEAQSEDHADSWCIGAWWLRNFSLHPGIRKSKFVPDSLKNFGS